MAKLRGGILGNIRGKVAGVVGGQYKDVNTLREYVKPANPNTDAQQAARSVFGLAVLIMRPLVGSLCNPFLDKFQRSMSGFNWLIKHNYAAIKANLSGAQLVLSAGPLHPAPLISAFYTTATGDLTFAWGGDLGADGAITDVVHAFLWDTVSDTWIVNGLSEPRETLAIDTNIGAGLDPADLRAYIMTTKAVNGIITKISASSFVQPVAP